MKKISAGRLLQTGFLAVFLALTFYPFLFLLKNSFKTVPGFWKNPWGVAWPPQWENYADAWQAIVPFLANSIVITALATLGVLVLGCLAGFAFARFDFPGKSFLYYAILAMMMVPAVLMLIPSFILADRLELIDTFWVMLLFYVSGGQVIAIFLLRNFFEAIPEDYFSAARIDGASTLQMLRYIALPQSKPILGTIAIITAIAVWNNFLWPLVTTSRTELKVITNGILEFSSEYGAESGVMFAGYILASIPMLLVILFCMRAFMRGLTAGGIKT